MNIQSPQPSQYSRARLEQYGMSFIETLGEQGLYGQYFSYDGYRQIRQASTRAEFEQFLRQVNMEFSQATVFENPVLTLRDMRFLISRASAISLISVPNFWRDGPYTLAFKLLFCPVLFPISMYLVRRIDRRRRWLRDRSRCTGCRYTLRGLTGTNCPECGLLFS